ncbi:MAG: hypothetical protein GF416_00335 [Candidatus Altiarchaeales archaeon]|nr:hypothetical protein [Candidatus Altiarchaeales archaeon]MBD3415567.1 hypothetical protein [Candidatus Altiarchaeales archaeon]
MEVKWSHTVGEDIGAIAIADQNSDGKDEVFIGLQNNTVIVLDRFGTKVGEFVVGTSDKVGKIYSMDVYDVDGDHRDEIILGLGGAKETRTYEPQDYEIDTEDVSIRPKDKVLYRVIRYHGGVYVINTDGSPVWRYLTDDSVKSVHVIKGITGGKEDYIAAGVGDTAIFIYNEKSDAPIAGETCTSEDITDEESGYASEELCLDPSRCCYGLRDCSCWWSESEEVCYRSYTKTVCTEDASGSDTGWRYVEYKTLNGSVFFLGKDGRLKHRFDVVLLDNNFRPVKDVDNTIRDLTSKDLNQDEEDELLIASNNGQIIALNTSNMSHIRVLWKERKAFSEGASGIQFGDEIRRVQAGDLNGDGFNEVVGGSNAGFLVAFDHKGQVLWKQRVDDSISDIRFSDVELDGFLDVIVAVRDGDINVYNSQGAVKWSYPTGRRLNGIRIEDLDGNDLMEVITFTSRNVTVLETTEFYIKRFRADTFYNTAYDNFETGEITTANAYLEKAEELYNEIGDKDSLMKVNLLRTRIKDEIRIKYKQDAERLYMQAMNYYAINDFENSVRKLTEAREVYRKIGDDEGVSKCDSLERTIAEDARGQRKLEADKYYNKAGILFEFGNYTGAVQLLDTAKSIYDEINHYNGSVQTDILVTKIADKNYKIALTSFETREYEKALEFAEYAGQLYKKVNYYNASVNAMNLALKANESLHSRPDVGEGTTNYLPYIAGLAVLGVVIIVGIKLRRPKYDNLDVDMTGLDDDLGEGEI